MKKIYHHYETWEDYQHGMYETVHGKERIGLLTQAIRFTGDAKLYGEWMIKVVNEWPISCEHNLTDKNLNKQAWVGHAAACMALKIPEDVTRQAWGCISEERREQANHQADIAIKAWYEKQNKTLPTKMAKTGLPQRHTRPSADTFRDAVQGSLLPNDMPSDTQERFGTYQFGYVKT